MPAFMRVQRVPRRRWLGRPSAPVSRRVLTALIAAALTVGALSAPALGQSVENAATKWNRIASASIMSPAPAGAGQAPHLAVLSLAMVQGAVYDAVNAIDGGREPYLVAPEADPSFSMDAAVASAAFNVLVGLFPAQQGALLAQYTDSLAGIADGTAKAGGIATGEATAAAMLAARANDGRFGPFTVVEGTDAGEWRLGPPQGPAGTVARDPAPWVGNVKPFLVPDVEMLRTDGPNALSSAAYAEDFNEIKELGSLTSTTRTADETAAAIFWQDSGSAIWNRIFRELAASQHLDVVDSARLYAMANLAAADGSIGCWNDKWHHSFWRPITAIRQAGSDGNPATSPDPAWVPLFDPTVPVSGAPLVTPGFPDHPSGHTCISGAIVHALKAFFGTDKVAFTAVSNKCSPAPCPDRHFARFSVVLKEIIDARVWSGIHFRTADVQGSVLGKKVTHYLVKHYFQPAN
jgi:hypothetical protein